MSAPPSTGTSTSTRCSRASAAQASRRSSWFDPGRRWLLGRAMRRLGGPLRVALALILFGAGGALLSAGTAHAQAVAPDEPTPRERPFRRWAFGGEARLR